MRAAINLSGVHYDQVERGECLATPGTLRPSRLLTVELQLSEHAARRLKQRSQVRLHVGTSETLARVGLLDRTSLAPGDTAFAQLFLFADVAGAWGQPLVIRAVSPMETLGGGYRLPDVIAAFGAALRPVGTTNKTRVTDYARAIGPQTGALMIVHPSNYRVTGFTARPELCELVALARDHGVPLIHDIGSGALIDFAQFGCEGEPIASRSVQTGADLVLFSGDKLLGGPQCGIVVGRRDLVDRLIAHPLSRALRVDKTTLAALDATLRLYQQPDRAMQEIPLLTFLRTPLGELRRRAEGLADQLQPKLTGCDVAAAVDEAFVGGGSLPHEALSSWSIAVTSTGPATVGQLADVLRTGRPPVVGRIRQDRLLLCLHAVFPEQDDTLARAVVAATESLAS